mmetsp:Transcript_69267/g.136898  ORF Transcript_69267/g.136898 Transcript_69267/m.136898 type:complete len:173 (-) Transcript_69267:179-697(-)
MAGHGYLVMGLLSILPMMTLGAWVVQQPGFRKGMPQSDLAVCWMCLLSTFFFPVTCGLVGSHKRQQSIVAEIAEADQKAIQSSVGLHNPMSARDWGFILLQLHLLWITISFVLFRRRQLSAPVNQDFFGRSAGSARRLIAEKTSDSARSTPRRTPAPSPAGLGSAQMLSRRR